MDDIEITKIGKSEKVEGTGLYKTKITASVAGNIINDLTQFEKDLLKVINFNNGTSFNYKNLMEWSSDESVVKGNLQDGESIYKAIGCYVAIKD